MISDTRLHFILFSFFISVISVQAEPIKNYSWQIQCVGQKQGCACLDQAGGTTKLRVYHMQAAWPVNSKKATSGFLEIKVEQNKCWYPKAQLKRYDFGALTRQKITTKLDHRPLPLSVLLNRSNLQSSKNRIKQFNQKHLGVFWPTYYHLALEDYHPGPKVPILSPKGNILGHASRKFQRQVMWEGSGISKAGLRLHYSGKLFRYTTYTNKIWAYGAGHNYTVWPYRTIAVNFKGVCKAMGLKRCSKKTVIGSLVWIKSIADAKITMSDGKPHDGYFCATDTGSTWGIRRDRIDMFVGVHGGGNPYLPEARRGNILYDGGIKSLVPKDWRFWKSSKKRVWCSLDSPAYNPKTGISRHCSHDYHTTARQKALQIYFFANKKGLPLKCQTKLGFADAR